MQRSQVRELERSLLATWPPLDEHRIDGWWLRAAEGTTGRANAVTVIDANPSGLTDRIGEVERWYHRRGLPPMFRLTPISEPSLDDHLARRGYVDRNGDTDTMVLDDLAGSTTAGSALDVAITSTPSNGWWAMVDRSPEAQQTMATMLGPLGERAGYATIHAGNGDEVAIGTAILDGERATVANLHTHP
ncbi:MAG: GNAT family N-acetyltransferase, cg3035/Rv0428c family, partial [Acidimicrobiales bacterium]